MAYITPREQTLQRRLDTVEAENATLRAEVDRLRSVLAGYESGRTYRTPMTPAPRERGTVLRPGATGYTTHIKTTPLGRLAIETDNPKVLLSRGAMFILAISTQAGATYDSCVRLIPRDALPKNKIAGQIVKLHDLGYVDIDYVKVLPHAS